jgi:hypothetical protein
MTKTTLTEPFSLTVEPIATAPIVECDCTEETKDKLRACPHTIDDLLLVFAQKMTDRNARRDLININRSK